uniref:Uncharacterized protein n=1 Tax=viral metagenome TaxID=1070528 RepID=A0A6H1ZSR7_9ZZZZ
MTISQSVNMGDPIPEEDFVRILINILEKENGATLIAIPGIYEILSEEFNNQVIADWWAEK